MDRLEAAAEPVELTAVPFHAQEAHHCGPASLLTVLEASGVEAAYDEVVERVYVPGLEGSLQAEMAAASRGFGRLAVALPPRPEAVFAEVRAGRPVLVLLNLGLPSRPVWHYAVVVGFDPAPNKVVLRSGRTERQLHKAPAWLRRWDWAGRWAIVLVAPGEWPATAERSRVLEALAAFEDAADPAAAGAAWSAATEHLPDEPLAWLGVGNAAYRQERFEDAADAYRRALALAPDHLPGRLNLASVLGEAGEPCAGLEVIGSSVPPADHPLRDRVAALAERLGMACRRPTSHESD